MFFLDNVYIDLVKPEVRFFFIPVNRCRNKRVLLGVIRTECKCSDDSDGIDEDLEDTDVPHKRGRKESTLSLRKLEKDAHAKLKKKARVIVEVIVNFLPSLQQSVGKIALI